MIYDLIFGSGATFVETWKLSRLISPGHLTRARPLHAFEIDPKAPNFEREPEITEMF